MVQESLNKIWKIQGKPHGIPFKDFAESYNKNKVGTEEPKVIEFNNFGGTSQKETVSMYGVDAIPAATTTTVQTVLNKNTDTDFNSKALRLGLGLTIGVVGMLIMLKMNKNG